MNSLIQGYYYRYRSIRKDRVKPLVDSNNYQQAKTELENALLEHESKFPDSDTRRDFNFGEKIILRHARDHLDAVISQSDPSYIDSETGQIKHQSDIVKEALEHQPKQDYSET